MLGALSYAEYEANWELVSSTHRPFLPFDQIDMSAIDGVIGQIRQRDRAEALMQSGVAVVNTSTQLADLPLPRVGHDDQAIGRMGARHLLERGFERLGFLGNLNSWYSQRRAAGFREVIEHEAKLPCHEISIRGENKIPKQEACRWLEALSLPIAIMAANDSLALALIQAAASMALRIPEDVAVLGVDNDRWAQVLSPVPISSLATDLRQIGSDAAQMLDGLMSGRLSADVPPRWIVPVKAITRGSTDVVHQPDPAVRDALHLIRTRCGEGIGVGDVLDGISVSRRTLENRLKRVTGRTILAEIQQAQIDKATAMVVHSQQTMGQIARKCGFGRQEQFNRVFKRITGLTPGQYRQRRTA